MTTRTDTEQHIAHLARTALDELAVALEAGRSDQLIAYLAQLPHFALKKIFLRRGISDWTPWRRITRAKVDVVKTKSPSQVW